MTNEGGYGIMRWQGSSRIEVVHRFVWALVMKRPIPAGKVLDHTCNVRRCCRPTPDEISGKVHLDPTTQRINMQRIAMRRKGLI